MASLSVTQIFEKFGGPTKLAERLGVPVTTAHHWKRTKKIPAWRMASLERAAEAADIDLTPKRKKAA